MNYLFKRIIIEEYENKNLSPYSCKSSESLGRDYKEPHDEFRTCFQRDRDRIIHTNAFRRLQHKTQVFVSGYGDHYRTRLTHTLEVAQISRDICRGLGLNEDLAESIALAHDLGHTPFGHAGEKALNNCMKEFGESFEHNKQSMRIVTELENHSDAYTGLNISKEIIEGLGKHESPYDKPDKQSGALSSLEAQVVNIADEIAYLNHDLHDGLRSGIININELNKLNIFKEVKNSIEKFSDKYVFIQRLIGKQIDIMINDVYMETARSLEKNCIKSINNVRQCKKKLVMFSDNLFREKEFLRKFLYENFYMNKKITSANIKGEKIIKKLFFDFIKNPKKLPKCYYNQTKIRKPYHIVRDYIAGMTDIFAISIK